MARTLVILLAIVLVEAHQPKYKIFEIRKTRDLKHQLDNQYLDPDFERIQLAVHREKDKKGFSRFAEDIVKQLQNLSERKQRYSSESSDDNSDFVDETRSLLVKPKKKILYLTRTQKENILQQLIQTALRTNANDVEDRTAPPRHRIPYEYDYND